MQLVFERSLCFAHIHRLVVSASRAALQRKGCRVGAPSINMWRSAGELVGGHGHGEDRKVLLPDGGDVYVDACRQHHCRARYRGIEVLPCGTRVRCVYLVHSYERKTSNM